MGEARRRREAREAGRPWAEDLLRVSPHAGMVLCEDGEWRSVENIRRQHRRLRPVTSLLLSLAATMGGTGLPRLKGG